MRTYGIARVAATVLLAAAALCPFTEAQSPQVFASARVPFAFRLGTRNMPEGVYQFRMVSENVLQMLGPGEGAFLMVRRDDADPLVATQKGVAVFRRENGFELETLRAPEHGLALFCLARKKKTLPREVRVEPATSKVIVTLAEAKP